VRSALWLRRTAVLLAVAGTLAGGTVVARVHAAASVGDCNADPSWPAARAKLEAGVLALVNAHRAGMGLGALKLSASLTRSAEWKARHMARYGYMAHDDPAPPVARAWSQRIAACGYAGAGASENIAVWFPTPARVMQAWLGSPGHRANIEGPWTTTGIGAAVSRTGVVFWAEDFGFGPAVAAGATSAAPLRHCVVPFVFRLHAAAAARRVRAAGCGVHLRHVHVPHLPAGVVAWQAPHRHVTMPHGGVVTLAINSN
jgi:uncharacterized protein YkwD